MKISKDILAIDIVEFIEGNYLDLNLDDLIKINNILGLHIIYSKSYQDETVKIDE